jgi:hypothetical protein
MTVQGNTVQASDFNGVRQLAVELISTGSIVGRGYGQDVRSGGTLSAGATVTPGYLDGLRNDLFNIRAHQIGTAPALAETAVVGNIITATDVATFTNYANLCDSNRFTADSGRMATTSYTAQNRTASWNTSVSAIFTITFQQGPTVARYFFNAGGQIRITSSRTGGAATSQNTSWSNLLSGAGTQSFGASTIYGITAAPTYTSLFTTTATAPYASNRYTISASGQGAGGGSGSVSQFNFLLQWQDPYVDPAPGQPPAPDDLVDGTLSYTVSLLYPVGGAALSGGGNWRGFNSNGAGGYFILPTFNAVQPIVGS